MNYLRWLAGCAMTTAAIVACVGDDPGTTGSPDASTNPGGDSGNGSDGGTGNDAPSTTDASDAEAAATKCSNTATFDINTIKALGPLNTPMNEGPPTLSADERTVWFSRCSNNDWMSDCGIWKSTRPSITGTFETPTKILDLASYKVRQSARVFDDGKRVVFPIPQGMTDSGFPTSRSDLMLGTVDNGGNWTFAQAGAVNTATTSELYPFYFAPGAELWLVSSSDPGAFENQINRAPTAGGGFGAKSPVAELAVDSGVAGPFPAAPVLGADGLTLFFMMRPSNVGSDEIYTVTRSSLTSSFGLVKGLSEINTIAGNETPAWVSPDDCRLYFLRHNPGQTLGGHDIFVVERTK